MERQDSVLTPCARQVAIMEKEPITTEQKSTHKSCHVTFGFNLRLAADVLQTKNELRCEMQKELRTSDIHLQCFVVVSITLQVAEKIASCNRVFTEGKFGNWFGFIKQPKLTVCILGLRDL